MYYKSGCFIQKLTQNSSSPKKNYPKIFLYKMYRYVKCVIWNIKGKTQLRLHVHNYVETIK